MVTKEQALNDVNDLLYYAKIGRGLPPSEANAMANRVGHCIEQSQRVPEITDDDSLAREIGEIGNQVHNLGCEHQNDEELSDQLGAIASSLWGLAGRDPAKGHQSQPVPEGWVDEMRSIAAILDDDGDENGCADRIRGLLATAPKPPQPVPEVGAMADALGDALRSKHAVFLARTKLVNLVRAMLESAPKPGGESD